LARGFPGKNGEHFQKFEKTQEWEKRTKVRCRKEDGKTWLRLQQWLFQPNTLQIMEQEQLHKDILMR